MSDSYSPFQRALVDSVLGEYSQIPDEETDESVFSEPFRSWVAKLIRKTQCRTWYYVNTTFKKVILIAIIISLLVVTALAISEVFAPEEKAPEIIVNKYEERYGIAMNPDEVEGAPEQIEVYYVPTFFPEGYYLVECTPTPISSSVSWKNAKGDGLFYCQMVIHQDPANDGWLGIDSEGVEMTDIVIGECPMKLFQGGELQIITWTDGSYFYILDAEPTVSVETMEKMILSMEVKR